ncbi:MAG: DUF58 domain-containing protein [Acidimicrobiia bacterium]|nr:DUF58 domain-containing protein [Acidimicrobiia bacterium]
MSQGARPRHRWSLTPAGSGVFSLFFPGLLIAAVARQPLLVAITVAAGLLLVANAILARVVIGRFDVTVTAPATATVGTISSAQVALDVAGPPVECAVAIDSTKPTWLPAVAPAQGAVPFRPATRGIDRGLTVRVATAVPLGFTRCVRTVAAPLDRPLYVAPRSVPTTFDRTAGRAADPALGPGDPIGLRPYVAGDAQRDVHWPSVARTGTLLVRDRRRAEALTELRLVVCGSGDGLDRALGRARALVEPELAAGRRAVLTTTGRRPGGGGPATVTEPVDSGADLLRRLAAATGGESVPAGRGTHVLVTEEGAWWRDGN